MWVGYCENCIHDMVIELIKLAEECNEKLRENQEMELAIAAKMNFCNSTRCHLNLKIKIRDHDHRTGKYR